MVTRVTKREVNFPRADPRRRDPSKAVGFCKSPRFLLGSVQNVPRSSWAFAVGVSCPRSSNYTPLPVGSLWGCCAFCEPVGTARKSRSACADLCRNVNSSLQKKPNFSRAGEWFRLLILSKMPRVSRFRFAESSAGVLQTGKNVIFSGGVYALGLIAAGRIQTAPAADLPELSRRYPQEKRPGAVRLPERVVFYAVFGVVR